jgi:hypothetical protein
LASYTLSASEFTTRFAFQHISNYDGTSDSVCLRCRSVVATSHYEYPLEKAESTHICQPEPDARRVPERVA